MKVVYFGTPQFAATVLHYLLDNAVNVVAVITKPDKPQGRSQQLIPTPVKQVALAHHLPLYQPPIVSDLPFAPTLAQYEADLFVVVAYGEIIKQHLLDMPKAACINVHGSLLPKYRGAAPIQRCLINGDAQTGITIMHMVKKMDAGPMIAQQAIPLDETITYGELEPKLCEIGKVLLLQTIREFEQKPPGTRLKEVEQDPSEVTYAPKIELEECQIDWHKPAQTIHNLVRGVSPSPGAWCYLPIKGQQKRLRVLRSLPLISHETATPGTLLKWDQSGIVIACGTGALQITELQLEGKKAMTVEEFVRGLPKSPVP